MWTAIYRTSDGHLVSMATVVADPLPDGLAKKQVRPFEVGQQWNPMLLDWERAPDPPPDIDRVDEFVFRLASGLGDRDEQQIRIGLVALLGDYRFRHHIDSYELRGR